MTTAKEISSKLRSAGFKAAKLAKGRYAIKGAKPYRVHGFTCKTCTGPRGKSVDVEFSGGTSDETVDKVESFLRGENYDVTRSAVYCISVRQAK